MNYVFCWPDVEKVSGRCLPSEPFKFGVVVLSRVPLSFGEA